MRFRLEQRFTAPLDAVEGAFVDPAVIAFLAELPGLGVPQLLEQSVDGDRLRQRVRMRFEGDLPSAAARVVDRDRLTWIEESTLDRRRHVTEFVILPDHYPDRLQCHGTVALFPDGPGTTRRVTEGELRVRAALVASRVERAIVSGLHDHAATQEAAVQDWLDAGGPP
ncbi:MAG: DUF2505 family protein [Acidimicrobiia bacterium]